jgi:hypothetical protein
MEMTKKTRLLRHMAAEDWPAALKVAATFSELGKHRDAIQRAHQANIRPEWARQMRRDPDADVEAGIEALRQRYQR